MAPCLWSVGVEVVPLKHQLQTAKSSHAVDFFFPYLNPVDIRLLPKNKGQEDAHCGLQFPFEIKIHTSVWLNLFCLL